MSLLSCPAFCQETEPANISPPELKAKRVLRIIANFSTSPSLALYEPLTPREKFRNCDLGACLVQGDDRKPKSDTSHHRGMLDEIVRLSRSEVSLDFDTGARKPSSKRSGESAAEAPAAHVPFLLPDDQKSYLAPGSTSLET
jgi:hypothetical protein